MEAIHSYNREVVGSNPAFTDLLTQKAEIQADKDTT